MAKARQSNLDHLRPAEKAIYQRLRPLIGRSDVDEMVAHLRKSHPVWSDVYNVTAERIVEVLQHAGLGDQVRRSGRPAVNSAEPAELPSAQPAQLTLDQEPADSPAAAPARASDRLKARSHPDIAAAGPDTADPPAAADRSERAIRRRRPARTPAEPLTSPTASGPQPLTRSNDVEQTPETSVLGEATGDSGERETASPAPDKTRAGSRPAAKKRSAGSVDELLQQIESVDSEVARAHAEIEQVNRRIAELERRRQALGDQLALTLRSRVPVEILRLAADAGKVVTATEQAG